MMFQPLHHNVLPLMNHKCLNAYPTHHISLLILAHFASYFIIIIWVQWVGVSSLLQAPYMLYEHAHMLFPAQSFLIDSSYIYEDIRRVLGQVVGGRLWLCIWSMLDGCSQKIELLLKSIENWPYFK